MSTTYELVGPAHISKRTVAEDGSLTRQSFVPGYMQDGVWIEGWVDDNLRPIEDKEVLELIATVSDKDVATVRAAAEEAHKEGVRREEAGKQLAAEQDAKFAAAVDRAVEAVLAKLKG